MKARLFEQNRSPRNMSTALWSVAFIVSLVLPLIYKTPDYAVSPCPSPVPAISLKITPALAPSNLARTMPAILLELAPTIAHSNLARSERQDSVMTINQTLLEHYQAVKVIFPE